MTPAINENRLLYLFEAVQCGTVRAAADRLDIAPSAVSRQIALLEAEMALPLIERHKRGVHLTQAGRLLMEYYREQRAHQEDLLAKLQEVRGLRRGHIRLAVGEGFVSDLMGAPLQYFCKRYPDITLTLDLAGTNEVMRRVAEDDADIGLVYNPPIEPKIVSRAQMRQPVHAIVAPDSPLVERCRAAEGLKLDALYDVPLALMHGAYGTRQLMALFRARRTGRHIPARVCRVTGDRGRRAARAADRSPDSQSGRSPSRHAHRPAAVRRGQPLADPFGEQDGSVWRPGLT